MSYIAVIYIFAFLICALVGNVFYLRSDKGIFTIIGLIPFVNVMAAIFILLYVLYILVDKQIIDPIRKARDKKWRYCKRLTF